MTLPRSYTWGAGIDNLLAVTFYSDTETNTLHAVTDPLGTVHALAAPGGTIAVSYSYDSWGNVLSVSGDPAVAAANRFTWQGREYSRAKGLYSFRARWYDPAAGRWLSKDPIGLEGGLNLYEAFGNNPVCFRGSRGGIGACNSVFSFGGIAQAFVSTGAAIAAAVSTPIVIAAVTTAVVVAGTVAIVSSSNSRRIETRGASGHGGHGKGERGRTAKPDGTNNPGKHFRQNPDGTWKYKDSNGKWRNKPPKWQPPMVSPIFNILISEEEKIEQE